MYKINVPEKVQQVMVTFGNKNSQLFDMHHSSGESFYNQRLCGVSQVKNFERLHEKSDIFESVVGNCSIFSRRFYELTKDMLSSELNFISCEIDGIPDFFMSQIITKKNIIDYDKSIYRTLTDGRDILITPAYLDVNFDGYICQDVKISSVIIVSEKFVRLIKRFNLLIEFEKIECGESPASFW